MLYEKINWKSRNIVKKKGLVTVWDDANYGKRQIKNTTITNNKTFLKSVKLDEHSITTILCHKWALTVSLCKLFISSRSHALYNVMYSFAYRSVIVTGNANGDIFFYDASLRALYHLNNFIDNTITSIAMINVFDTSQGKSTKII